IDCAVALAQDPKRLAAISAKLRPAMAASPLMDSVGFAHEVEAAYRKMWHDWCAKSGRVSTGQPAALPPAEAAADGPTPAQMQAAAHLDRGNNLFQAGQTVEAEKAFRDAIALNPALPEAHVNLGTTLKRLKRPLEAIESYQQAMKLRPDWASAYSNL